MTIRYTDSLEGLAAKDLRGFWEGWPTPPSPERHLRALDGSEVVVLAIDEADGRVVGFVTVVGDGAIAAFVPLLEVLPGYRGRGIGSELVRRALERLGARYAIDLVCDEDLVPFYERLGFSRLTAMARRDAAAFSADHRVPSTRPRGHPSGGSRRAAGRRRGPSAGSVR